MPVGGGREANAPIINSVQNSTCKYVHLPSSQPQTSFQYNYLTAMHKSNVALQIKNENQHKASFCSKSPPNYQWLWEGIIYSRNICCRFLSRITCSNMQSAFRT